MQETHDVVVLGAGSAGEVVAGRLADQGFSVAVVERDLVGGACPFWACMPAKALLRPGQVVHEARNVPGVGHPVQVDVDRALQWRAELADHWDDAGHVEDLLQRNVSIVRGAGRLSGERRVDVEGWGSLTAHRAVIIATGSRPLVPDIDGSDRIELWDSRRLTSATRPPESLLLIGGGAVGLEMAQAWRRLGSERVVLVEAEDRLLPNEEPIAGDAVALGFASEGIEVLTGSRVTSVSRDSGGHVSVRLDGDQVRTVEVVASAAGRTPATDGIGLESVGMEPGTWIEVDSAMRTLAHPEWLYAIGDVNGQHLFTHMGKYEARVAAEVIGGAGATASRGRVAVPRVIFTDPLVAAAGLTAAEARAGGIDVDVIDVPVASQAEAALWGEEVEGTARFVVDRRRRVLVGATFVGPSVLSEMVIAAQIAIVGEVPVDVLRHVVPQFPTFSEVWLALGE